MLLAVGALQGAWQRSRRAALRQCNPEWMGGQLTGHCVAQLKHGGSAQGLAAVGGQLVSGGANEHLRVWGPRTGQLVSSVAGRGYRIAPLPGGRFATAPFTGKTAQVWDAASATRICELQGHTGYVNCVAAVPAEGLVATGSEDATVRLWCTATGAHRATLEGHTMGVRALALLADGRLASGGVDDAVRLWDVRRTHACTAVLKHANTVYALCAVEWGWLASGCGDRKVHLWNGGSGAREWLLQGHVGSVNAMAALPRSLLASGSEDMTVRVWSVGARACVAVLEGHASQCAGPGSAPAGRWCLAAGRPPGGGGLGVWIPFASAMAMAARPSSPEMPLFSVIA